MVATAGVLASIKTDDHGLTVTFARLVNNLAMPKLPDRATCGVSAHKAHAAMFSVVGGRPDNAAQHP